jgi:uncharacterized protein (DUF2236 family)
VTDLRIVSPTRLPNPVEGVRRRLGEAVFRRVAGAEGPQRRQRIAEAVGPRWFAEDSPVRRVHGDAAMFVGGLRALLLQSLHPLAMAAVDQHSGYRSDPWGRLQRTSYFLAVTSFGAAGDAELAVARVRAVHSHVTGVAPDGRAYRADDPHLVRWVHVAEVDSFLEAYQRYSGSPLDQQERDEYIRDAARVAEALGAVDPPRSEADLREQMTAYRAELASTPAARAAARFLLLRPPVPLLARGPYAILGAAAVASLPTWARWPLRLPRLPIAEATVVRASGRTLVATIGWVMGTGAPAGQDDRAG